NARAPIVDLAQVKSIARIEGIPAEVGKVYLEDQFGNRIADIHVERGARLTLTLPADKRVYVRCRSGEAELVLRPHKALAFDRIRFEAPTERMRGALDLAMKKGLFTTAFGPNYYRGFIAQQPEFISVPLPDPDASDTLIAAASARDVV